MLNEERIRIMTKMASYEEGQGKEYMPVKQYYRKDYVSYQMIRTFLSSTISFGILFLFWVFYSMDSLMKKLAGMDMVKLGISVLIVYAAFTVIYQVAAFIIYNRRYARAAASMKQYQAYLKKVIKLQEREERLQPMEDWE